MIKLCTKPGSKNIPINSDRVVTKSNKIEEKQTIWCKNRIKIQTNQLLLSEIRKETLVKHQNTAPSLNIGKNIGNLLKAYDKEIKLQLNNVSYAHQFILF